MDKGPLDFQSFHTARCHRAVGAGGGVSADHQWLVFCQVSEQFSPQSLKHFGCALRSTNMFTAKNDLPPPTTTTPPQPPSKKKRTLPVQSPGATHAAYVIAVTFSLGQSCAASRGGTQSCPK